MFRLSVEQYHAMIQMGVLTPDDAVELLEGFLIQKMPKNPRHRIALAKLRRAIESLLPGNLSIQMQDPITLPDSEPEPDVTVFRGRAEDYPSAHPGPDDINLVVEISEASLRLDRGMKLRAYARAGIVRYWIVNLVDQVVEVYTDPDVHAPRPAYRSKVVLDSNAKLPLTLNGKPVGTIDVAALFP